MVEPAAFRKPDRYKASSYRAYNGKMPSCYDTAIWSRGAASIDRAIIVYTGGHAAGLLANTARSTSSADLTTLSGRSSVH